MPPAWASITSLVAMSIMRLPLREAEGAVEHGDVPIGAVMVREGEVLAAAGNERERRGDPTAHAEVLACVRRRSWEGGESRTRSCT